MWQTCHCNGQLDKCRGVAERCGTVILYLLSATLSALRRGEQVMQGEEKERSNERREGGRDRESDFQRDNEPLNDG